MSTRAEEPLLARRAAPDLSVVCGPSASAARNGSGGNGSAGALAIRKLREPLIPFGTDGRNGGQSRVAYDPGELVELLQQTTQEMIWEWDPCAGVLFRRNEFLNELGYADEEIEPTDAWWTERIHPEDRERVLTAFNAAVASGSTKHTVDYRLRRADGTYASLSERQCLVRNRQTGALERVVGSTADVSHTRHLEEQLRQAQKMEALGRLAGGIAHDFNNMLSVILGYSEIAIAGLEMQAGTPDGGNPRLKGQLRQIYNAAERAAELTRHLLAFSRRQVLEPRVLHLNRVLEQTDGILRRLIGADVELVTLMDPELDHVQADPSQLDQVLMNLVVNARDAMPQGGKVVVQTRNVRVDHATAALHPDIRPGDYVVLSVCDNGCGMEPDVQSRIFDPFFTTKEEGKGTGLGLATVYGIVRQSGGFIEVESLLGMGSTFSVYLPRVACAKAAVTDETESGSELHGSETVLLVEDEPMVRTFVVHLLERAGYKVLVAEYGSEAVGILETPDQRIDLLLSDVVLPGISGREVAEKARALRPGIKVLMMSGYTDEALVRHGVEEKSDNFLRKPFERVGLLRKVREALGPRHAGR